MRPSNRFPRTALLPAALFAVCGLLLQGGCSLPEDTAALVNGRPVPTAALDEAYEEFLDRFGELLTPGTGEAAQAKKALLDDLIDRELMRQEVERRGLMPPEDRLEAELDRIRGDLDEEEFDTVLAGARTTRAEWRVKTALDMAVGRLQEEVAGERVVVAEEEIDKYYRTHRGDFEVPELVRASQILVRTREEARAAAKRIRGGEDFAAVAREISLSPDGEKGGDLGFFARGEMPQEFDAVTFTLDIGKVSPVVETTYGFHLFLVTDRREARLQGDAEARKHIRSLLRSRKSERAFREWLAALRAGADIRYNNKIAKVQE